MSLVAFALAAQAVAVAPDAQERDLRCVAVIAAAIGTVKEDERTAMVPLATYYVGRVTGRDPKIDLEAELVRLLSDAGAFEKMMQPELQRCSGEMQKVGADLQKLGKALSARGGAAGK